MVNNRRFDPYKSFKFLVSFGAVSLAAFGVARKLMKGPSSKARKKHRDHVFIEEQDSGARPIEAVGLATAPKRQTKPRAAPRKRAGTRKSKPRSSSKT